MLAVSIEQGSSTLLRLVKGAVARLLKLSGQERTQARRLFDDAELLSLAGELGAVRASGAMLGRALVADHGERVRRVNESLREGWITLNHTLHVHVDQDGKIDKGPKKFVGKGVGNVKSTHPVTAKHGELHPETGTKEGPLQNGTNATQGTNKTTPSHVSSTSHSSHSSSVEHHAAAVLAAFGKLAKSNMASLADLKDETGLSVPELHAAVQHLRKAGKLSASNAEGREGVTPREQAALLKDGPDRIGYVHLRESVSGFPVVLQSTDYTCGAAAIKACCDYHGLHLSEAQAARLLGTTPRMGTQPDALIDMAGELGLRTEAREDATLDDLAHAIEHGAPCICCVQRQGCGHWVTVVGLDEDYVYVADPIDGAVSRPREQFERDWWDTAEGKLWEHFALAVGAPIEEAYRPSSLHAILEAAPLPSLQPDLALDFFRALVPTLGTDPLRTIDDQRRTAFTLAVATDEELLASVQAAIAAWLGQPIAGVSEPVKRLDTPAAIRAILDEAGVSEASDGYATTVFRTNAMDSYNQGVQDQLAAEAETFPAWTYSNPHDGRSRPEHAARDGNLYPTSRTFNSVRGTAKKDVLNCRCVPIPVDRWSLEERLAAGETFAE